MGIHKIKGVVEMAKGKYADWLGADGLLLVEAWARDGLTEEQIAHNMGITRETLRVWKNKFPVIIIPQYINRISSFFKFCF
mgnify:CR=1 FL=1